MRPRLAGAALLPGAHDERHGARILSVDPRGVRDSGSAADAASPAATAPDSAADPFAALAAGIVFWRQLSSLDSPYASVLGTSAGGQRVLYRDEAGYWVHDVATGHAQRVDTFFDGTPLPADVSDAAISGDGETVALLRTFADATPPRLRIVRLDGSENFEFELPYAGQQTWSSGWVEHCSVLTRIGRLHLSDDGTVAWFPTSPCYYDHVLALDVRTPTPHWRFVDAFRNNTSEVTADGRTFALGGDFCRDRNWNYQCDPGEPLFTELVTFPIEFDDQPAVPQSFFLDWPVDYYHQFCSDLPYRARTDVDGAATRMVVTTSEPGLDPDTIVYPPGQQLYWTDRSCHMHSLGGTTVTASSDLRMSTDGRSVARSDGSGILRTELATHDEVRLDGVTPSALDPLLLTATRARTLLDGDGMPLGSVLESAQLSGTPSALKVAIVGDSYISGEGSYGYVPGSDVHDGPGKNLCHRSVSSWAYQLGQRLAAFRLDGAHPQLAFLACSGATTQDVEHGQYGEEGQLERLGRFDQEDGRPVDVVFVSAGGNDAGFKSIIETCMATRCLVPGWTQRRLDQAATAASNVETTLEQVKAKAPHATVFLTGYPSVIDPPGGDCQMLGLTEAERAVLNLSSYTGRLEQLGAGFRIDASEQAWLNDRLIATLNDDLERAAVEAGVHWIDPSGWFHGHGVCDPYAWGNGLMPGDDFPGPKPFLGNESFHPNPDGYAAMASQIEYRFGADFGPDGNPPPIPQGIHRDQPADEIGVMTIDGELRAWGDAGHVTLQNLPDGTRVAVGMYSNPTLLASGTVGPDGSVDLPYTVPSGLYPGLHALVAYDADSGEPLATTMTAVSPPDACLTGWGDVDVDEDGLADRCDALLSDGPAADDDHDGVDNDTDDCPTVADPDQADANANGIGDACDPWLGYDPAAELTPFPVMRLPRPAPTIALDAQPPAYGNSRTATFAFRLTTEESPAPALSATCSVDWGPAAACTSPFELHDVAEGYHTLQITASSATGTRSDPLLVGWGVDLTPPTLSIDAGPVDEGAGWTAFRFSGADTGLYATFPSYRCADDGGLFAPCYSPHRVYAAQAGSHTFAVKAVDQAGNESPTAVVPWTSVARVYPQPGEPTTLGPFGDDDGVDQATHDGTATAGPDVAPRIAGARIVPRTFRATHGATIRYRSAHAAVTTFVVQRLVPGTSRGGRCRAAGRPRAGRSVTSPRPATRAGHARSANGRCTRALPIGRFRRTDTAGPAHVRFDGRVHGHLLAPGSYRLLLTPRDGARIGGTVSLTFTVMPPRRRDL